MIALKPKRSLSGPVYAAKCRRVGDTLIFPFLGSASEKGWSASKPDGRIESFEESRQGVSYKANLLKAEREGEKGTHECTVQGSGQLSSEVGALAVRLRNTAPPPVTDQVDHSRSAGPVVDGFAY